MSLPVEFIFSQTSIQDYLDCPRRFELRHIHHQEWPALESEPVLEHELFIEEGILFHQRIYQLITGIPSQYLVDAEMSPEFQRWWQNFLTFDPLKSLPSRLYPEYTLTAHFGRYQIAAKYDLLAFEPGKQFIILDWKTSQKRTPSKVLAGRAQSRLYPFLLVEAGNYLNNQQEMLPHQIEMRYWFSNFPADFEVIPYNQQRFDSDRSFLSGLMEEIENLSPGQFQLTHNENRCLYCQYRSLCDRGSAAGYRDEMDEDIDMATPFELDFDQLGEIPF